MNGPAQTYMLVARALRVDASEADNESLATEFADGETDWRHLLELADGEHITAALASVLRQRNLQNVLPKQIWAALDRREFMGAEINRRIKRQAVEAVELLNTAGVTPMVLKGGLHFFEAPPEALSARVVRDLDVLVPADKIDDSIQALRDAGYMPEGEDEGWTYHYRPMHHPNHIVAIELHIRPGEQRSFLTAEEAWATATPVDYPGLQLVSLAPGHRIAHNIFHSEVQDHGYMLGEICFRQLYDLAMICARYKNDIDWDSVLARMNRNGMAALFRARMHMAVALLGAPVPTIAVSGFRSRRHLKRCFWQMRLRRLMNHTRWAVGVLSRFNRYHIDLLYECGATGLTLQVHRIKHLWIILRRHRGDFDKRLVEHGRRLQ